MTSVYITPLQGLFPTLDKVSTNFSAALPLPLKEATELQNICGLELSRYHKVSTNFALLLLHSNYGGGALPQNLAAEQQNICSQELSKCYKAAEQRNIIISVLSFT